MEGHRHPGRIFAGYHRRAGRLWVGRQPDAAPGDAGQDERAIRGGGHADPGPATTASPAATPAPSAISYGPVTSVAGTSDCQIGTGTMTTGTDGVEHYREAPVNCIDTSNDPRASGTFTASWNVEWWGTDGNTGANVQWGTAKLVNAGGAWEGRGTGVYSTDRGGTIVIWFKGTGGYAGLTYFWEGTGPASPWIIHGLIHPGEPPTP